MIIGVDIGGMDIKAGRVLKDKIVKKVIVKTEVEKGKQKVVQNILNCIDAVFDKKVKAIGIGCPGPADYEKGVIGKTPNIPLKGVNLKRIIFKRFRKRVVMANDASCFVLGEAIRLKRKLLVGLTLGTGVGGGIVIDGKLYYGKGNAGELGHCTIKFDGPKCRCGNIGCLAEHVSTRGIKRMFGKDPIDLKSRKAWDDIGRLIGIGITNIANAFDPGVVVLGGGISRAFNKFKTAMNKEIKKRAMNKVKVIKGRGDSGILGAADLV